MKKRLSIFLSAMLLSLAAFAQEQVTVTAYAPSDCGVDLSNGAWLAYWADYYEENAVVMPMTIDGQKLTASFPKPEFESYYGFRIQFKEEYNWDDLRARKASLTALETCWEFGPYHEGNYYLPLVQLSDCDAFVDHNYQPTDLKATPLGRDSILFEWNIESEPSQFSITCFDTEENSISGMYWYAEKDQRSIRVKANVAERLEVASWQLTAESPEYVAYNAKGEGFAIDGDDRIPHNLTISDDGENLFTIRWEASDEVHHFDLSVTSYSAEPQEFNNLTVKSQQVTLADDNYYTITVTARDAEENALGGASMEFNNYAQEARNLVLHFYIPEGRGFIGTKGAALVWRDNVLANEHVLPLVAEGEEAPHWYSATVADFKRQTIRFSVIDAQTAGEATQTVVNEYAFGEYNAEGFFVIGQKADDKSLYLTEQAYDYQKTYPNDYAPINLAIRQEKNKVIFSWENASANVNRYSLKAKNAKGEEIIWTTVYTSNGNEYAWQSDNAESFVITEWSMTPYNPSYYEELSAMRIFYTEPFTVAPSPYLAKNLKAQDNGDGTYTFSWDVAEDEDVKQYSLHVRDASGNEVLSAYDLTTTSVTKPVNFMFSGKAAMSVFSYGENWSSLGNVVDSFEIAPVAAHDINIRILINPMSGIDTSAGVQFNIKRSAKGDFETVDATNDKHGWWKYTLNTTERGAIVRVAGNWSSLYVYGDTCVAYTGSFVEEDCNAHDNDYMPQNLLAMDNGDGTWTLSWSMDYTEKVGSYQVSVMKPSGEYVFSEQVNALQVKTPVLAAAGNYLFQVNVYDKNYNRIGYNNATFDVAEKTERDIVLRVLTQPGAPDWSAFTYNTDDNDYTTPVVFTDAEEGWKTTTFNTTAPAVTVRFWAGYRNTDFTISEDACIEVDRDQKGDNYFRTVDCSKAHLQNFTLSNLKVDNLGAGKFEFSWECLDNPYRFHIRAMQADSSTTVWSTNVSGEDRKVEHRFINDSTMELVWYIVPLKEGNYWSGDTYLWDKRAFGQNFTAEASAFIPQNVKATANGDGTWTIRWDALPAGVAHVQVEVNYPNGSSSSYNPATGETQVSTDFLGKLGTYTAVVMAKNENWEILGQANTSFNVVEVAERALNVRVLLHPDAERSIESMNCETGDGVWKYVDPVDEGEGWYKFTFNSTMPAPDVQIFGYQPTIFCDTCLQFHSGNLRGASCDEVAHDYRIDAASLKAVSEPGRVTFSWTGAEKADYYQLRLSKYDAKYDYWYTFEWIQTAETSYTFIVEDKYDGEEIKWSVQASDPHSLNEVEAAEKVTLHKSQILLSELKATSSDSIHYALSWKCNTDTVQYQVQVRLGGYPLFDVQQAAKSYNLTAVTGYTSYEWQIRAVNAAGEALTPWSQASFQPKKSLRALKDLKAEKVGNKLHFTWNTSASKVMAELWRQENTWSSEPMFPKGDSIIVGNSFDFEPTKDGVYYFYAFAMIDMDSEKSTPIDEGNYVNIAHFTTAKTYKVNVSTTVGGTFWGMNPSGEYPENYELRLCPGSDGDYRFVRWSDGSEDECRMIKVTSDTTLIALYEEVQEHRIIIDATEGGILRNYWSGDTISRIDSITKWSINISIEAVPNEGYDLYEWSDGESKENTRRYLNLNSDTTIIAVFKPICYVSVAAGDGGRVQVSGAKEFSKEHKAYACSYGSEITIKANPDEGFRFKKWSDGDINIIRTITVKENLSLSAVFEEVGTPLEKFAVRILSSDIELGEVNQVSGNYYDGDKVTIIATPKEKANFKAWSDGVAEATRIITVTSDTTIIAQFEYKRLTLHISAGKGGSVNTEVNGTYDYGTEVTITATPDEHFEFVSWSDGDTRASRTFNITEDTDLKANFAKASYIVTFLNADGALIESNRWAYGEMPSCSVTPTLAPTSEWIFIFKGWTPEIVAVTGNAVYTAVYDKEANPTGIDETIFVEKATKVMINGQIFILRGDKIYTIQGQVVR